MLGSYRPLIHRRGAHGKFFNDPIFQKTKFLQCGIIFFLQSGSNGLSSLEGKTCTMI